MRISMGLAILMLTSVTAVAQVKAPPTPDPNSAPPDKIGPPIDPRPVPKSTDTQSTAPLSEELSHSQGVVKPPPAVDPGMSQPPPDPGPTSTPVLKPPANSDVKPK